MVSHRMSRFPRVESRKHQRQGYQEQKDHGSHNAVSQNNGVVLVNGGEAISHSCVKTVRQATTKDSPRPCSILTIVSHCVEISPLQVGEKERVFSEIPRSISHHHGIGVIADRTRRGELVWCRRHDGGDEKVSGKYWRSDPKQSATRFMLSRLLCGAPATPSALPYRPAGTIVIVVRCRGSVRVVRSGAAQRNE
jgi:hypothetical protein